MQIATPGRWLNEVERTFTTNSQRCVSERAQSMATGWAGATMCRNNAGMEHCSGSMSFVSPFPESLSTGE